MSRCPTQIEPVFSSSRLGGLKTIEDAYEVLRTKGPKRLSPFMLPRLISNLAPGWVSILTGARGQMSPVSACATGAHSWGSGRMIRSGLTDMVIAGGAESTITPWGCRIRGDESPIHQK